MALGITVPYLETLMELPGGNITAFIVLLVALAIAFDAVLVIILKVFGFIVGKTKTSLDDRILKAAGGYLPVISILTALWLSLEAVFPDQVIIGTMTEFDIYIIAMLIVIGLFLSSLVNQVLIWYGLEIRPPQKHKVREEEVFPFVRNVVRIAIVIIFIVFVLQRLGFDTTAIITGLGIGGIAVALALQDTLANFFGGVHILVDKPFREYDYIRVDPASASSVEGTVKQIGWRTTRIMTPFNNEVIVPNSKLAGTILENYSSPDDFTGVGYQIGVDYKEDVDKVEKIIGGVLEKVARETGLVEKNSIWVRFDSFGDYALIFKFGYMVQGYVNRHLVLKAVNKDLLRELKKNNVNIPFPTRVIHSPPNPEEKKK